MPEQSEGLCADVIDGGLAQEEGSTRQEKFWNIAFRCGPRSRGRHLDPKTSVEKRTPPLLDLRFIAANVIPGR
jgi:hypothetical protein